MFSSLKPIPFLFLEINAQNDFFEPQAPMLVRNVESIRRNMKQLNDRIRRAHLPLLAAMDAHHPSDPEFATHQAPPHALVGSAGGKSILEVYDRSSKIIPPSGKRSPWPKISEIIQFGGKVILEKNQFDLFSNPASREILQSFGARLLYLYGAALETDIYATSLTSRTLGYDVIVLTDATGARDFHVSERAKEDLLKRGIRFEWTEEALIQIDLYEKRKERERRQRTTSPSD